MCVINGKGGGKYLKYNLILMGINSYSGLSFPAFMLILWQQLCCGVLTTFPLCENLCKGFPKENICLSGKCVAWHIKHNLIT